LDQQLDQQIKYQQQLILAKDLNEETIGGGRNLNEVVGRFDEVMINDSRDKLINASKHDLRIIHSLSYTLYI